MPKIVNHLIEHLLKDYLILKKPNDKNTAIWRYINFVKFMSLLQKRKLFFPKGVCLLDPFEGTTTKANISSRLSDYPHIPQDIYEGTMKHMNVIKRCIYVNCWNISENEANLMWESYMKENFGVAIRSTFERLSNCFQTNSNLRIRFGKVKYVDYNIDKFNELVGYLFFLHKRKIYKYENELRAMTILMEHEKHKISEEDFTITGIYIPVDLDILIEKIVVSPKAESWHIDLVKSIMEEYNLKKNVGKSSKKTWNY